MTFQFEEIVLVISHFLQILCLQPRISKVFSFIRSEQFQNKIPFNNFPCICYIFKKISFLFSNLKSDIKKFKNFKPFPKVLNIVSSFTPDKKKSISKEVSNLSASSLEVATSISTHFHSHSLETKEFTLRKLNNRALIILGFFKIVEKYSSPNIYF